MMADFKVTLSYLSKHNPEMPMEAVIWHLSTNTSS
jgi:hypothetical protein